MEMMRIAQSRRDDIIKHLVSFRWENVIPCGIVSIIISSLRDCFFPSGIFAFDTTVVLSNFDNTILMRLPCGNNQNILIITASFVFLQKNI